ncbi:MAG TPA: hypothetical protein VHM20_07820 [Gammaproteobacteria bacterium]|jgi:hypothetical protein|nr:hypothetical protein [Gammaproteobacteria bacterium]
MSLRNEYPSKTSLEIDDTIQQAAQRLNQGEEKNPLQFYKKLHDKDLYHLTNQLAIQATLNQIHEFRNTLSELFCLHTHGHKENAKNIAEIIVENVRTQLNAKQNKILFEKIANQIKNELLPKVSFESIYLLIYQTYKQFAEPIIFEHNALYENKINLLNHCINEDVLSGIKKQAFIRDRYEKSLLDFLLAEKKPGQFCFKIFKASMSALLQKNEEFQSTLHELKLELDNLIAEWCASHLDNPSAMDIIQFEIVKQQYFDKAHHIFFEAIPHDYLKEFISPDDLKESDQSDVDIIAETRRKIDENALKNPIMHAFHENQFEKFKELISTASEKTLNETLKKITYSTENQRYIKELALCKQLLIKKYSTEQLFFKEATAKNSTALISPIPANGRNLL